jgi:subtilisin family serine protease
MTNRLFRSKLLSLVITLPALLLPGVAFAQPIHGNAAAQINEILAQKRQLTGAQKKLDSSLVFAAKKSRGELAGTSFDQIVAPAQTDSAGRVVVDIKGVATEIAAMVNTLGGQVLSQHASEGAVRAALPLPAIETLANSASVTSISAEEQRTTNSGSLTSQGYISHTADYAVRGLGITGAGIKVGVLSDSASPARVAALIASGDLPANTVVLTGQASSGTDEGTAMMEIVHDLAPGAQLYFATANGGQANFANNILALRAAGCNIIVDDVTYFAEGAFQDGIVAQAVNTVVGGGALYFSSAGNEGNITNATSGTWEGDFLDAGPAPPITEPARLHNFRTAVSPQAYDSLVAPSSIITLKWSDPLAASTNDYDLFILDSTGTTVKGFSVRAQTGTQDPFEQVNQGTNCGTATARGYCPAAGDRVVVVLFSGQARALLLNSWGGLLSIPTTGATATHNAGNSTISVAATYWNSAHTGVRPFTGLPNPVETFSSDGPRRIFYTPNGAQITPGNVLIGTNGGVVLMKPDISAADGGAVRTPGFLPFFGTSAAAPHAAAVAALVWSANPSLTNTQVKSILLNTALDNMSPGWDRDGGFGLVMAYRGVQAALGH